MSNLVQISIMKAAINQAKLPTSFNEYNNIGAGLLNIPITHHYSWMMMMIENVRSSLGSLTGDPPTNDP